MKPRIIVLFYLVLFSGKSQSTDIRAADSLYALGNYSAAINKYAKDGSKNAQQQIARAYHAIGNYEKAITQYEHLVRRDSLLQIARFELGKLYLKTKEAEKAEAVFSKLTKSDGNNPEYFYYLGLSLKNSDREEKSIAAFENAVAKDSTHLRSLFQLAKYYVAQQENNSALYYINKGLEFYENDVALINLKALAYFNNDEYEKAKPLFEELLAMGEQKEHIYNKLAYCYYKNWELERAKATYRKLLSFDNARAKAFYGLGETYWRDKQLDSAQVFFKASMAEKKPYLGNEFNALARIARQQNDLKTAFDYYKKAYKEDPLNHFNYYQVCAIADQYYEDPKVKLTYYERFIEKFGEKKPYFSEFALKRILELREEIHFAAD